MLVAGTTLFAQANAIQGGVDGKTVNAGSTITRTGATCYTRCPGVSVYVSGTYGYVNTETLATGTSSNSSGNAGDATIAFTAPANCISVNVSANHSASYGTQTWTGSTSANR